MVIAVAELLQPYAELALARLRYLYPATRFTLTPEGVEVSGSEAPSDAVAREILYALYREKIYSDTLPMRRALIEAVTRR